MFLISDIITSRLRHGFDRILRIIAEFKLSNT
jgi:hypothetical protein